MFGQHYCTHQLKYWFIWFNFLIISLTPVNHFSYMQVDNFYLKLHRQLQRNLNTEFLLISSKTKWPQNDYHIERDWSPTVACWVRSSSSILSSSDSSSFAKQECKNRIKWIKQLLSWTYKQSTRVLIIILIILRKQRAIFGES